MHGFHGRFLHVDLSAATCSWRDLDESRFQACLGGIGLGASLLYDFAPSRVESLAPQNPLIFTSAPLVGPPGEMEDDPNLARAVLTAMTTTNEQVRESQREAAELMWRVQVVAFRPEFDQTTGVAIVRILGQVWFAALMGWVNGWRNITKVGDELEFCARFLLEPYD